MPSSTKQLAGFSLLLVSLGKSFFSLGIFLLITLVLSYPASARPSPGRIESAYNKAKHYYYRLKQDPRKAKYRDKWLYGIDKFKSVLEDSPDGDLAAASLYMIGEMFQDLHHWSGNPLDIGYAVSHYEDVAANHPENILADDALYKIGLIYLQKLKKIDRAAQSFAGLITRFPNGDMVGKAEKQLAQLQKQYPQLLAAMVNESPPSSFAVPAKTGKSAAIQPIKYWSNNDYTRVVIETSAPVSYKENLLEPMDNMPRRLYVDLENCIVPANLPRTVPIQDGLLKRVRCAQFKPGVVRVVLDTHSFSEYKIFNRSSPFKIVIDVTGEKNRDSVLTALKRPATLRRPHVTLEPPAQKIIVLDPGHGGKDSGAIGPKGLKEKDVVLRVAQQVAKELRNRLNVKVLLTRDRDVFVELEDRTAFANKHEADLFISIHANAARNRKAKGVETYILNMASSNDAMLVAARENAATTQEISELQTIFADLLHNSMKMESLKLAEYIQENMITGLSRKYSKVTNLGVKEAPFVVLMGARMPAILAEISFISNPVEARRLRDRHYLNQVADHLVTGITDFMSDLSVARLYK